MRACIATAAVALSAALPLLGGQADAQQSNALTVAQPAGAPLALTVTSVSPSYAEQGRTVTITGRVRNLAAAPATGLSIRLRSSKTQLGSRPELENYASGSYQPLSQPVSTVPVTLAQLGAGHTWSWTIRLPVRDLGLSCFGVYPLTVEVRDAAFDVAHDPVPLPYWPAKATACPGSRRPRPFPISWIWPLIDVPRQGVCGLINNGLATSIAPDGRLGYLLDIGRRYSARAALTWAIDPSLLDSVRAMRQRYPVGASAMCHPGTELPASPAASRWLAGLVKATARQPVFLTPYADVDIAALTRHGNQFDLDQAFAAAAQVGHQILHRNAPAPVPAGPHQLSDIAWPADGIADRAVLVDLLATEHVRTVILAAPAFSPVNYTPSAVASKLTGIGKKLHILLADHAITALLGSKRSASRQAGSIFGTSQLYLAETAMIAAQAPGIRRSIVVAPPRRWDPPRQLASNLLAETVSAPWLKPSTAGQLVTMRAERVYPSFTRNAPRAELPGRLLGRAARLDRRIALLQSIRVQRDPALSRAVLGIESSAWRGKGAKHAQALLARTTHYVNSQLSGISIRGGPRRGVLHITLGGKSSSVNVFVHNALRYPVQVGLLVQASKATVSGGRYSIRIPAKSISGPVNLTVHVEAKQGTIRLSLIAPKGSAVAGQPLPAYPLVIIVHPTNFGTFALAICAIALALFVTASAFRAIRNGRPAFPSAAGGRPDDPASPHALAEPGRSAPDEPVRSAAPDEPARSPASDESASSHLAHLAAEPLASDLPAKPERHTAGTADPVPASSPSGWITPPGLYDATARDAASAQEGFPDLGNRPEDTDSVGGDGSELTSASPSVLDQEPAAPDRRATEEPR